MGNSFAHLPDFSGDQHDQRTAITNFYELLKPGGILVIDHRNYDYILEHGAAPTKNIYYSVNIFCPQFLISLMSPFCDLLSLNWAELGRVAFSPNSICVLHVLCSDALLLLSLQSKHIQGIKTSVLYVNNQPNMITLDYQMEVSEIFPEEHTR